MSPFIRIDKVLGEDVGAHSLRMTIYQFVSALINLFLQEAELNSVASRNVSHVLELSSRCDSRRGLVVLVDKQDLSFAAQEFPHIQQRDRVDSDELIQRNQLCFDRAVGSCSMLLREETQREEAVGTDQHQESTTARL